MYANAWTKKTNRFGVHFTHSYFVKYASVYFAYINYVYVHLNFIIIIIKTS